MSPTPIKPYPIGTPVIVVRAARVVHNVSERVFAAKITAQIEPYQGQPRYALEGQPGLAYFHRELFTDHLAAQRALNEIEAAERRALETTFADAEKQLLALKLPTTA